MINYDIKYSCSYYSVGYFVFAELDPGIKEPILEVEDEGQGHEYINWLTENQFVSKLVTSAVNDNF